MVIAKRERDSIIREAVAAVEGRFAALEARIAALEGPEPSETFEAVDFAQQSAGHYSLNGFEGKSPDRTLYRVKPGSSTKPPATGGTTPYRIMRAGPVSGALRPGVVVRRFTLDGYQEQVTHGLTLSYTDGAIVEDIDIRGIKGFGTTPPGETFSLELHQSVNPLIRNVEIDGTWNGVPVASSLLGFNTVDGGLVQGLVARNAAGFGAALWQSGNYTLEAPDFRFCRRALNLERPYGLIRINQPDLRDRTSRTNPDVVVATAGYTPPRGPQMGVAQMSATVIINEPIWDRDRGWPLTIGVPTPGNPYSVPGEPGTKPHTQRSGDVTVIIDGTAYSGPTNTALIRIGNYWG